jgi:hypothetical protein
MTRDHEGGGDSSRPIGGMSPIQTGGGLQIFHNGEAPRRRQRKLSAPDFAGVVFGVHKQWV